MRKLLVIGGAVAGVALAVRPLVRRARAFDMSACIEAMPEGAPPKWMFANITAIRRNTDRILEILEPERPAEGPPPADRPEPVAGVR